MTDGKPKTLDPKSIIRISQDLSKATVDPQTSPSTYTSLLQQLRGGVNASEDLLRSTKIGIVVNKLKDEKVVKDEGVRKEAHDLVNKWKRDIQAKKGGASPRPSAGGSAIASGQTKPQVNGERKSSGEAIAKDAGAAAAAAMTTMTAGVGVTGEKWKGLKPEERSADKDGVNWKVTGNGTRDKSFKLLYDGLVFKSTKEHCRSIYDFLRCAR